MSRTTLANPKRHPPRDGVCSVCQSAQPVDRCYGVWRVRYHLAPTPEHADLSGRACRGAGRLEDPCTRRAARMIGAAE